MNKYKKKPIVIEAIKYNGDNINEIVKFIGEGLFENEIMENGKWVKSIDIETLEGTMKAKEGDFIIKGVNGEFYPCKPDIFHKTYK